MILASTVEENSRHHVLLQKEGLHFPADDSTFGITRYNFFQLRQHIAETWPEDSNFEDFPLNPTNNLCQRFQNWLETLPDSLREKLVLADLGLLKALQIAQVLDETRALEILSCLCDWKFSSPRFAIFQEGLRRLSPATKLLCLKPEEATAKQATTYLQYPKSEDHYSEDSFVLSDLKHPIQRAYAFLALVDTDEDALNWLMSASTYRPEEICLGIRYSRPEHQKIILGLMKGLGLHGEIRFPDPLAFFEYKRLEPVLPGASHPALKPEFILLNYHHVLEGLLKVRETSTQNPHGIRLKAWSGFTPEETM